ncbi:Acetokinase family-domain-containing protein [Kalaharituber pfeilii]|nr:Acetokinase family-domain-containing protein [Kalaharituber pfeilii]
MAQTYILSINAGSSSVKLSLYAVDPDNRKESAPKLIIESSVSKLTSPPAVFSYIHRNITGSSQKAEDITKELEEALPHDAAFELFLVHLSKDPSIKGISSGEDIRFACHRVVHGGDLDKAVAISHETYHYLEQLTDLAPLHNAPALAIVKSCLERLPKAQNIAFFDSTFHLTMPGYIKTYPLNVEMARERKIRKYGFHGISYSFISRSVAEFFGKRIEELNIIALHLGSGASICAIQNGKSLDTTMGLTPLEGLPGASRSGTIDPSLVFHYTSNAGKISHSSTSTMHISKAEEILNKYSGWTALTGTSNFSDIAAKASSTSIEDQKYRLAFDIFIDRIIGYLGSYYVKLGGKVDALVFAGGIGEKSSTVRKAVVERLECLGFKILDDGGEERVKQTNNSGIIDISAQISDITGFESTKKQILVCNTDEQFEMARDCALDDDFWA